MVNHSLEAVRETLTDDVLERISSSSWGPVFQKLAKHERNIQIIKAYRDGVSRSIVARMFNVTPSRINKLVQTYIAFGVRVKSRG